ncbi:MAG: hypothetical protein GTN78_17860, partial [Gemmatimonadales bacterium]|nr:hypothetical protein [Gemmatimonadales bacterium]
SAAVMVWLAATPALAEEVVEVWRSPFGTGRSVSVSSIGGSCWAVTGARVMHVGADGTILGQHSGFERPEEVSVNSMDGSCWVRDALTEGHLIVHLACDGTELLRVGGFDEVSALSVNSADGSCWVGHSYDDEGGRRHEVLHLAPDGSELARVGGFHRVDALSVSPADGSCWVGHSLVDSSPWHWQAEGEVVRLAEDGTELMRVGGFQQVGSLSVNTADGSCWAADWNFFPGLFPAQPKAVILPSWSTIYVRLAADGAELWRSQSRDRGKYNLSVNVADGSWWAADSQYHQVVHFAADGTELWRLTNPDDGPRLLSSPLSISVNATDGSCWVANGAAERQVLHLAADGTELWSGGGLLARPRSASVDPGDGSC